MLIRAEVAEALGVTPEQFDVLRQRGVFDVEPTRDPSTRRPVWSVESIDVWSEQHPVGRPTEMLRASSGLVNATEAAGLIGVTVKHFAEMRRRGEFTAEPVPTPEFGRPVWRRADVEVWVEERRI